MTPHPLSPYLLALAEVSADIDDIATAQSALQDSVPDVNTFATLGKQATTARKRKRQAYLELKAAALNLFDGDQTNLHDDVQIALYKEARVDNHAAALLWLLGNAADTVNVLDTADMTKAVNAVASRTPLILRRSQALAVVEELFAQSVMLVDGWVVVTSPSGVSKEQWFHETYPEAPTVTAALKRAEAEIHEMTGDSSWHWRESPTIQREQLHIDQIRFAEPICVPKPRISQDLSHLLEGKGESEEKETREKGKVEKSSFSPLFPHPSPLPTEVSHET